MAGRGAVWHLLGVRHLGLRVRVVFPMHTVWYRELAYVVTFLDGLLFQGLASKVLHTYDGREENSLSVRVAG